MFIFTIFKGIRLMISTVMTLVILVVALPYIASTGPFRDGALRMVLPQIDGQVTSSGASLGWFSAVQFTDVEITSPDGTSVLRVPNFQGEKSLWQYVGADDLGTIEIDGAQISIVVTENGTNLGETFSSTDVAATLKLTNASLGFQGAEAAEPWTVEGVNLDLALEPAAATESGKAELVIQPATLLADTPITPAMCDDLLKYIVPILSGTTTASGNVTVELAEWRIPLDDPGAAQGGGQLVVRSLDASGGPLITELARQARVPNSIRLPEDSRVAFSLAEGRIHHRDLQFSAGGVAVVSEGSVGLDQSLDLTVEVPLSANLFGRTPSAGLLANKTVRLPITGKFGQPAIGAAVPDTSNTESIADTTQDVLRPPPARPALPEPTVTTILPPRPIPPPQPVLPPPSRTATLAPPSKTAAVIPPQPVPSQPSTATTLPPLRPQATPPETTLEPVPRVTERPRDHLLDRWRDRYR